MSHLQASVDGIVDGICVHWRYTPAIRYPCHSEGHLKCNTYRNPEKLLETWKTNLVKSKEASMHSTGLIMGVCENISRIVQNAIGLWLGDIKFTFNCTQTNGSIWLVCLPVCYQMSMDIIN